MDVMADQRRPRPFNERFGIDVGIVEAKRRFLNRVTNDIFNMFFIDFSEVLDANVKADLRLRCANALGEKYQFRLSFDDYVKGDFYRCLQVLETLYRGLQSVSTEPSPHIALSNRISHIIGISKNEVDFGIDSQPPAFVPTGARLLDERLVNDPLHWLDEPKYKAVYDPFKNGLSHFLESEQKPRLLKDIITDMYEAVEALANIGTERRGKTLSAIQEPFIKKVGASEGYKKLLKEYIAYAHKFRHAYREPGARPMPARAEVESFMYLTGLFIRLAVQEAE